METKICEAMNNNKDNKEGDKEEDKKDEDKGVLGGLGDLLPQGNDNQGSGGGE